MRTTPNRRSIRFQPLSSHAIEAIRHLGGQKHAPWPWRGPIIANAPAALRFGATAQRHA
jgi:hypothetical protein